MEAKQHRVGLLLAVGSLRPPLLPLRPALLALLPLPLPSRPALAMRPSHLLLSVLSAALVPAAAVAAATVGPQSEQLLPPKETCPWRPQADLAPQARPQAKRPIRGGGEEKEEEVPGEPLGQRALGPPLVRSAGAAACAVLLLLAPLLEEAPSEGKVSDSPRSGLATCRGSPSAPP